MIVTCLECHARFAVKATDIGYTGRRVRCSRCRHIWFQNPDINELERVIALPPEPTIPWAIPSGSNLPVAIGYSAKPLYMQLAFACMIILFVFTACIAGSKTMLPYIGWYYNIIGISDDAGITLDNVTVEKLAGSGATDMLVKGRIVNQSPAGRAIPNLRLTLRDENGKKLRTLILNSQDTALTPEEGVEFENYLRNLPENITTVVMDIGNQVSLAGR